MFTRTPLMRGVARLLIVTVTAMTLQPLTAVAQVFPSGSGGRYAGQLGGIEETLAGAAPQVFSQGKPPADSLTVKTKVKAVRDQGRQLEQDDAAELEFSATEQRLRNKNLPAEILSRHAQAVAEYRSRKTEFKRLLQNVADADDQGRDLQAPVADMAGFMVRNPSRKAGTPTQPDKLPWGSPKPVTRQPYTSPAQFQTSRLFGETIKLAQAGGLSGLALPSAALPATPTAEDLAETEDVQLTPAIRAQADALNRNPVAIYNWVRNNIEFIPSYGSIQGSDMTLQTKRGNAFDTASLLIALLRASNIAARYVYGTVEAPADKVINWVGGVNTVAAAQGLMGQGGIPNAGIAAGAQIAAVRFEHVWVEAYVDYVPSRGAVNRTPDTWVPMDASFKQADAVAGADLAGAIALNAQGALDAARAGAVCTPDFAQSVNAANLQSYYEAFKLQATNYLAGLGSDLTVAGALGARRIGVLANSILLGTLPYQTVAVGSKFAAIPDNLRWKLRYLVYASEADRGAGNAVVAYSASLPAHSGKRLTLSFAPASAADQQVLDAYLPAPHADGSPVLPAEFPPDLPAYLIRVAAQVRVDGQLASSGGSLVLGQELIASVGHYDPAAGAWSDSGHEFIAGEYHALAVDGQGVAAAALDAVKSRLAAAKAKLNTHDYAALTRDDVVGDLLYQGALGYFALLDANNALIARASGAVDVRLPSYARAYAKAEPEYALGIVMRVRFPGVALRADRIAFALAAGTQSQNAYIEQSLGRASSYAHLALERAFAAPGMGASTMRSLASASAAGQRIYALTQSNIAGLIDQVMLDADAKADLSDAAASGRTAVTQSAPLAFGRYQGGGYVLADPQSGAAAYLLSSRSAGGASAVLFPLEGMPWLALTQPAQAAGGAAPALAAAADMAAQEGALLAELQGTASTRWSFFGPKDEVISALFLARLAASGADNACLRLASAVATDLATTAGWPAPGTGANHAPVISSVPVTAASAGVAYQYQVVASDADGDSIAFRLADAPTGMSVGAGGLLAWQAPLKGSFVVTVRADDGRAYAEQRFVLTVGEGVLPLEVSVLTISPSVASSGDTVTIGVASSGGAGATLQVTVNGVAVPLNAQGQAQVSAGASGAYRVVATVSDGQRTITKEAVFTVRNPGDTTAPVAQISAPADDAEITAPVTVTGSATDANFAYYQLLLRPAGAPDSAWQEIGRGYQPVTNGTLGRLDPTILANGIYELGLYVVDVNNQVASRAITLDIYRDLKIGQFAISFEDLAVEASGIPIRVTRTYDTRRKGERLDFGYGWSVDYQSMTVRKNGVFGLNWDVIAQGLQLCLRPAGAKKVNITLPTGKVERFTARNEPECGFGQVPPPQISFTALAGTTSTLEVLNVPNLLVQGGQIYDADLLQAWNPKEFKLTTEDGFMFYLSETVGITEVRDPFGNKLSYTANGVIHSNGQSVAFTRDAQGRITAITDPQGKRVLYTYDARGDLVGVTDRLSQTSSLTYNREHGLLDYTDPRGTVVARYTYDAEGRLVAATDADGTAIQTAHDMAGNREVVTDRRGGVTTYSYDSDGNVTEKIDALGNRTATTYDGLGNELTTTDANGKVTTRTFHPVTGKPLTERDPLGNTVTNAYNLTDRTQLDSVTDARGNTTGYGYQQGKSPSLITEPLGRVTSIGYSSAGGNLTSLDIAGQATAYGYDAKGNRTSETDALGNQTTYTFDASGNETGRIWSRTVNGVVQTFSSSRTLDANARVLEETDPLGAKSATAYNAAGKPSSSTDALQRQTTYSYDAQARLVQTGYPDGTSESVSFDAEGNELTRTDRAGRVTRFEYDALNRLTKTLAPDGASQETLYDAVGRVRSSRDALGRETVNGYDDAGRLTSVTDPTGAVTRYEYDPNGNRTRLTDAQGAVTDYEYDALNRLVKTTFPPVAGGTRPVATIAWRPDGRKLSETDANGHGTAYGYDAVGRLKTVTQTANAVSQVTTYAYDEVGNKTVQIDAESRQTKWAFDAANRPTQRTLPLGQAEAHSYDLAGNRVASTDFMGRVTRYSYDENNRPTLKALPDGTRVVTSYTASGQVASIEVSGNAGSGLANGLTLYAYDAADRLIRQDNADGSFLAYAYDANGNRTEVSTPSGTTRYGYDQNNRLISVTGIGGETTRYGYDVAGNRAVTSYPNNTRSVHAYDPSGRVTQIAHIRLPDAANPNPTLLLGLKYTLKLAGQKAKLEEYGADAVVTLSGVVGTGEVGGTGAAAQTATITGTPARTVDWSYDETDKLTQEKVTEPINGTPTVTRTTSYAYDKVGNRKTKTEVIGTISTVTTYSYDANDRLTQEVRTSGGTSVTVTYGWDANGNLASKTQPGLYSGYVFDTENRLVEVKQGSNQATAQTIATYAYDGAGDRVAKTVNGQTTKFLVDANQAFAQVLEETGSAGDKTLYTRGAGLISQSAVAGSSYIYPDHLGSTRLIADAQANAVGTLAYEAFGQVAVQSGAPNTYFRFAGEYGDAETGFSYNRARYLDLATGRFIATDPFTGYERRPTTLHKYLYANANPLNRLDPSGTFDIGLAGGMAVVGLVATATYIATQNPLSRTISFDGTSIKLSSESALDASAGYPMALERARPKVESKAAELTESKVMDEDASDLHHTVPIYMCGHPAAQILAGVSRPAHRQLHSQMVAFNLAIGTILTREMFGRGAGIGSWANVLAFREVVRRYVGRMAITTFLDSFYTLGDWYSREPSIFTVYTGGSGRVGKGGESLKFLGGLVNPICGSVRLD